MPNPAIFALAAAGRAFACGWRQRDNGEQVLCSLAGPVSKAVPIVVRGDAEAARVLRKMGYQNVREEQA